MNQPNVLVIADDPEFPRSLLGRWNQERVIPTFTIANSDVLNGPVAPECDLAIVGPVRAGRLTPVLKALDASSRPTVCLAEAAAGDSLRQAFTRVAVLRWIDGWEDALVMVGAESLRRVEAVNRLRRMEQAAAKLQHQATLGRYMTEVRHGLNNALTSVLGNAELLLLQPDQFSQQVREQLETIHTMSLKMHEMMYRFSSLQNELQCAERQSHSETASWVPEAAAGA